jgi:hypothetical protein
LVILMQELQIKDVVILRNPFVADAAGQKQLSCRL